MMDVREGVKKDSIEFDYVFDASQGSLSPSLSGCGHCWLFTENELQVFRLSGQAKGSRVFKWLFETPSGAELSIRFVEEVVVGRHQYLLVSLNGSGSVGPEMRLLDLRNGQCAKLISISHGGRPLVASTAIQVPKQRHMGADKQMSLIVGTEGGCIFALDIELEASMEAGLRDTWRVRDTLLNGSQVEQRNLFKYRENVLAKQRSTVTALQYLPDLPGFAVGFSFAAFQVYAKRADGYVLIGSSPFKSGGELQSVVSFVGQQSRGSSATYLWVVKGSTPASLSRSIATASLYCIPDKLSVAVGFEDADRLLEKRLSCASPSTTASSRLLCCASLPRSSATSSDYTLIVWESTAVFKGTAQKELHLEVSDLRTVLSDGDEEFDAFHRFTVTDMSLATGSFDTSRPLLGVHLLPGTVDWLDARMCSRIGDEEMAGTEMRDSYVESSLDGLPMSFDVALLSTEDVTTYRLSGAAPAALEKLASTRLDEDSIEEHYLCCVEAGLIPRDRKGVPIEVQWTGVLKVLLDNSMVSVICQYLISENHTLRPGLVYDWIQAEASTVVRKYSGASDNDIETIGQQEMDCDYTRLADCFSIMRALLTLQPSSGRATADTLRTLQFIEFQSWLSQLDVGHGNKHHLEQQCYTMSQTRQAKKKPHKLFLDRVMRSLEASIDDSHREDDSAFLSSSSSYSFVYPVDIRRLIRQAAPEVMMTKRCLVFYYLLDVASIDEALTNAPEEFADAFMLPNCYRKVMKSIWMIDCADWENYTLAAQLLSEFWTNKRRHNEPWASEILSWAPEILSALLHDSDYRKAHLRPPLSMEEAEDSGEDCVLPEGRLRAPLLFYYAAQPSLAEKDLELACMAILLGSNDPIQDSFAFQRRLLRRPLSQSQRGILRSILFQIFTFAQERGVLDVLFLHCLDDMEEGLLVEYFEATEGLDFLLVYYLQRCRYKEAVQLHEKLSLTCHSEERSRLLDSVKHLIQPFEDSPSFGRLHASVQVKKSGLRSAKIVPGWTGPPATRASQADDSMFSSFAQASRPSAVISTPRQRGAVGTPGTVVHTGGGQAVATGQRINRFLQTPVTTPLASGGLSATQRRISHQLATTPFRAAPGARNASYEPTMSPFPSTPTIPYHVPFGSVPGDRTPAFERPVSNAHDMLVDDL